MKKTFLIIPFITFLPSLSLACSCADFPLHIKWDMSENIFLADITYVEVVYPERTRVYFRVNETFKGSAINIPYFAASEFPSTACGMDMEQGDSYYVFAEEDSVLEYDMCSLTTRARHVPHYTEVLRKLQSKEIPSTFYGVFDTNDDVFIAVNTDHPIKIYGMNLYEQDKYKVIFRGYELSDGSIYSIETITNDPAR